MKANQGSAFGLLGFLQSLQQGQEQQLQRREQYLQEDKQRYDQDRQFALAQKAEDRAASEAQRQQTLFERGTADYNTQAPVRQLATDQALFAPKQSATTIVGQYEGKRQTIDGQIAELLIKYNGTRDQTLRDGYRIAIKNLQQNRDNLATGLEQDLGAIAGLTDRTPYMSRFRGAGVSAGTGATSKVTAGVGSTTNTLPNGIDTNALVDNALPPMTAADREAIIKAANQYNLGASAAGHFAYPTLATRSAQGTDVYGNPVNYKVGEIINQGGGINFGKFIPANMDAISSMLQNAVSAGGKLFAKPREVLSELLGPDENLWPVRVGTDGRLLPKEGANNKSWYDTLSATDKQRFVANIRPFITIDEATQRGIDLNYNSTLKGIESRIQDYRDSRDQAYKNAELKFDATSRKDAAAAGRTGDAGAKGTDFIIARDGYKSVLNEHADGVAADEQTAKGIENRSPDVIESILGANANGSKVPLHIISAFYSRRATLARTQASKIVGTTVKTAAEIDAKSTALSRARNVAGIQAKKELMNYVTDKTTNMPDDLKNAAIAWLQQQ